MRSIVTCTASVATCLAVAHRPCRNFTLALFAIATALAATSVRASDWAYVGIVDELHEEVVCVVVGPGESSVDDVRTRVGFVARYDEVEPTYSLHIAVSDFYAKEARSDVSYELPEVVELLSGHVQTTSTSKVCSGSDKCVVAPVQDLDEAAPDGELRVQLDALVQTQEASTSNGWKGRWEIRNAVFSWDLTHWTYSASKEACAKTAEPVDTGSIFNGWFD